MQLKTQMKKYTPVYTFTANDRPEYILGDTYNNNRYLHGIKWMMETHAHTHTHTQSLVSPMVF